MILYRFGFLLAALHRCVVFATTMTGGDSSGSCGNGDDFVSCPSSPTSPFSYAYSSSSTQTLCSCTCNNGGRKLRRIAHAEGDGMGLRGANSNELDVGGRDLGGKWWWDDCWAHYWCGFQEDVDLADTGLEPDIRARWETGAGAGGDGIVDDLKELICEDGVMSGRCSGGEEEDGKCKDPALNRPGVLSPTYWVGGFGLDWEAKKTVHCESCCVDIYTVTLTFDDAFDCNPGKYGALVICGIAGPYDVKYKWEITIECTRTCPPTKKPTKAPSKKPSSPPVHTTSTSSTYSSTESTPVGTNSSTESTPVGTTSTLSTYSSTESTLITSHTDSTSLSKEVVRDNIFH